MLALKLKAFRIGARGKAHHLKLVRVFIYYLNSLGANRSGGSKDYDATHLPILACQNPQIDRRRI
jgi:hypothetical protein